MGTLKQRNQTREIRRETNNEIATLTGWKQISSNRWQSPAGETNHETPPNYVEDYQALSSILNDLRHKQHIYFISDCETHCTATQIVKNGEPISQSINILTSAGTHHATANAVRLVLKQLKNKR